MMPLFWSRAPPHHNPLLVEFSPGKPDKYGVSGLAVGQACAGAALLFLTNKGQYDDNNTLPS